jgi:hypothetical protein
LKISVGCFAKIVVRKREISRAICPVRAIVAVRDDEDEDDDNDNDNDDNENENDNDNDANAEKRARLQTKRTSQQQCGRQSAPFGDLLADLRLGGHTDRHKVISLSHQGSGGRVNPVGTPSYCMYICILSSALPTTHVGIKFGGQGW